MNTQLIELFSFGREELTVSKEPYAQAEMDVIFFESEDVIVTSGELVPDVPPTPSTPPVPVIIPPP